MPYHRAKDHISDSRCYSSLAAVVNIQVMLYDFRGPSAAVGDELDLEVDTLHEEIALALGKYRHHPKSGEMRIQVIAFTGDR
jgi:hypothetical protein